jgi:hypothetical protein
MVATIATNPYQTTNAAGSFQISSGGLIQGTAYDQPAIRNSLAGGVLANTETIPMWGGVGISLAVPGAAGGPQTPLGPLVTRAMNLTANAAGELNGFSVFDQNYAAVNTPQSPVPLTPSYGSVHYYLMGSGARIAVQCSPNLVNLEGEIVSTKVSWDFANQQLEPYASTTISSGTYATATTINSGTYVAGTGLVTLTTNAAHGLLPGDTFTISGATGTGSFASINGTFVAGTGTTGSTLVYTIATGLTLTITGGNLGTVGVTLTTAAAHGLLPGDTFEISGATGTGSFANINGEQTATAGTTGSTLNFVLASGATMTITGGTIASGGVLNVLVLSVSIGDSMTVSYNSVTGLATWVRNGNCAVIQI